MKLVLTFVEFFCFVEQLMPWKLSEPESAACWWLYKFWPLPARLMVDELVVTAAEGGATNLGAWEGSLLGSFMGFPIQADRLAG